jgi:mitochondrial fission protein ELM1
VLESLIGKGKRLEGQQSQSGFTRQVLAMAGSVVKPTYETLQVALKSFGMKHLRAWCTEHFPQSVQSKRRRDLGTQEREQKPDKVQLASTPMF